MAAHNPQRQAPLLFPWGRYRSFLLSLTRIVSDCTCPQQPKNRRPAGTFAAIAYHLPMRSLLFVLMIALLLLRGWMGDAMATGMALAPLQHQQSATTSIATHAHGMSVEEHFYHVMAAPEARHQAQAVHDCASHSAADPSPAADAQCESCTACQACHTLALSPATADSMTHFKAFTRPSVTAAQFASAETAPGQKPPIS